MIGWHCDTIHPLANSELLKNIQMEYRELMQNWSTACAYEILDEKNNRKFIFNVKFY